MLRLESLIVTVWGPATVTEFEIYSSVTCDYL